MPAVLTPYMPVEFCIALATATARHSVRGPPTSMPATGAPLGTSAVTPWLTLPEYPFRPVNWTSAARAP